MKNHKKTPKLSRVKIVPMILITILLTMTLTGNLIGQKRSMNNYLVSAKTREADLQIERLYEALETVDLSDSECVEEIFRTYKNHDADFLGILVKKDQKELYTIDSILPDQLYQYTPQQFSDKLPTLSFSINNGRYYMNCDLNGNSQLYKGICNQFNMEYALEPIGGFQGLMNMTQDSVLQANTPRGYQDFWFYYEKDGYDLFIGHTIPLFDIDYQLAYIYDWGYKSTVSLVFFVMVLFLIRVFLSQYRILKAYYLDRKTGGKNWFYFQEIVAKRAKRISRLYPRVTMIYLGLEKYEAYGAYYGEEESEKLLKDFYHVLKKELPRKCYYSRYEGCEFGIGCSFHDEELKEVVARIITKLQNTRQTIDFHFLVGAYHREKDDKCTVMEAFSRAAIAAKNGKVPYGELSVFDDKMAKDLHWEQMAELDFARAIQNKEFEIYLQPKYDVHSKKIVAAEALVRWNHPTEGFLTPYRFIPIYEKNGLIVQLDDYMVRGIAELQASYISRGLPTVPISVNLSRYHFIQDDLAEELCRIVDEYKIPHNLIEFELTESAFFDDKEALISKSTKLREEGFSVSLDDFGSGFSSLNSLRELPIDIVKLDAGFFRGAKLDEKGEIIVKEIISLSKQLGLVIVAEGIEEEEQVRFLADADCDIIQGYYFAKPMTIYDFDEKMKIDCY